MVIIPKHKYNFTATTYTYYLRLVINMSTDRHFVPQDLVMADPHIASFCEAFPDMAPCFETLVVVEVYNANLILSNPHTNTFIRQNTHLLIPLTKQDPDKLELIQTNLQNREIFEYLIKNQEDYTRMPASECLDWIARGAKADELPDRDRTDAAGGHASRVASSRSSPHTHGV